LPLPGAEEVKKAKKDKEFASKTLAFFTPSRYNYLVGALAYYGGIYVY
jgi:hypothetical protein